MSMTMASPPSFLLLSMLLIIFIVSSQAGPPTFDKIQQEYLGAHNNLRRTVGMPPLQWDPKLAAWAYDWANQRKVDCDYTHHSTGPFGESIFWQLYPDKPPTAVVQKWFSEQKYFDHAKFACRCPPEKPNCQCGHYLNIVWKTTTKVGCSGRIYCNNQKGVYHVCSYDPIGNMRGANPFNPPPRKSALI